MSRYGGQLITGNTIAFGFDRQLGEYFLQEFDTDEEIVFSIMNHTTTDFHPNFPGKLKFSNGEFVELMKEYLPQLESDRDKLRLANAIECITLDLPF